MQRLFIRAKDENGREVMRAVDVVRSWSGPAGTLYLHKGGVYGYKDGEPVRALEELEIIGDAAQRKAATRWWKNAGQRMARERYGDEAVEAEASAVGLDSAVYWKTAAGEKRSKKAPPLTWNELGFERRPEWWGEAESLTMGGFVFEMAPEEDDGDTETGTGTDENGRARNGGKAKTDLDFG